MSRAITGARGPRHSPVRSSPALPFGMEGTAGAVVEGDDARRALYRELNFFPTPPWAARAGGELIQALDPQARTIWEPACGAGHMARPLAENFDVRASDLHDYGQGSWMAGARIDFLAGSDDPGHAWSRRRYWDASVDWVVTNPPFAKAEAFVEQGLRVATRGVAMLCRLAFVESVGRYPLMRKMAVMAPFAERVPMQLGSWDPDLSSATAYAWFIWMHDEAVYASAQGAAIRTAHAHGSMLVQLIPPGTCARLTRPDDRVRFAGEAPDPQMGLL